MIYPFMLAHVLCVGLFASPEIPSPLRLAPSILKPESASFRRSATPFRLLVFRDIDTFTARTEPNP